MNLAITIGLLLMVVMVAGAQAISTHQAFALKNFFNCMTAIANKDHKLTVQDVNTCYHKEFKNAG